MSVSPSSAACASAARSEKYVCATAACSDRRAAASAAALAWALAWPLTHLALLAEPALLRYGGLSGVLRAGAAVAAVALGATVIEKHLTLDCTLPGPDHSASLEPAPFGALVRGIRRIEAMLGDGQKMPTAPEREVARVARRSVVAAQAIAAGHPITPAQLACRRPGTGIAPADVSRVAGRVAGRDLPAGTVLQWSDLVGGPPDGPG